MRDPFERRQDPMVLIANAALPVLLDRLGGSATVTEQDVAALTAKYGGHMGVQAIKDREGVIRLTLARHDPPPEPKAHERPGPSAHTGSVRRGSGRSVRV
jgi:hypothetical protein